MNQATLSSQEFVSIVSHDLRAPIRHMSQFSAILVESLEKLTDDQQQCVAFIQSSAKRCNQMMDALTQLSRVHTNTAKHVPIHFVELLELAVTKSASQYHCQPILEIKNSSTESFSMDASHAQTVIQALTDNAFKFRDIDKTLGLQLDISNSNGYLTLVFTDNGIGIPASFIDHCTTIFKQHNNKIGGVGIGLTLVASIAALYQGSLTIESNVDDCNGGTKVTVTLPL